MGANLFALFLYGLVWLVAVLIFGVLAIRANAKSVRYVFIGVLLLPVVLFAYSSATKELRMRKDRDEMTKLSDDYASFCGRRSGATETHLPGTPGAASILVRYATLDGKPNGMPTPDTVARLFFDTPPLCETSGVREVQYVSDPYPKSPLKGILTKIETCPYRVQPQVVGEADAEYELVFGQKFEEFTTTHHGPWGYTRFLSFEVQLRGRHSGEVRAAEVLFSASPMLVGLKRRCPIANDRIAAILRTTLPK